MADKSGIAENVITLPQGGGAQRGLGETFAPDLQTGTGNFTVPIALPAGRNGFQPGLSLTYSTGHGNGPFGMGWSLNVPGVTRKTSKGVPRYRDAAIEPAEQDTFFLSGAEDLVRTADGSYRPRTEGLFAQIERHTGGTDDFWEVRGKDGLVSRYGTLGPVTPGPRWRDAAVIADPADPHRRFAWKLSETEDPFGNRIEYEYFLDDEPVVAPRWVQSYLEHVRYVEYTASGETKFLVSVDLSYELRPDAFSDHRAGFEIRTQLRCHQIRVATHGDQDRTVRTYELTHDQDPLSGVSLLQRIEMVGWDGVERLPPVEFGYTSFAPERRYNLLAVKGDQPPPASLARADYELADLTGDGLPDVLELNGVARYWRNLGGGRFDRPRLMKSMPGGLALANRGVQLMDADGDGRIDLVVTGDRLAGYFPLRFDGEWDGASFRPFRPGPTFDLEDPEVKLVDLDGDGVADVIRSGSRLTAIFHDPERARWYDPTPVRPPEDLPACSFADPRVKWADLSGDGLQDLVLVHDGCVEYWPNTGHGTWGRHVVMHASPQLPKGYDPKRILLGDVNGDGLADFVYVDDRKVTLWINQSGNGWSDPVEITGTPAVSDMDAVRTVDLLGSGVAGVLWSSDAGRLPRANMHFLDLTGARKPYLLNRVDNHLGAVTLVEYRPSTSFYLDDQKERRTRWRTALPFPVQVVARVEVIDAISRGKLTREYRYTHGYWDGVEREFRGFGLVEQRDSEDFDQYRRPRRDETPPFVTIPDGHFSPPTLTRTWFHLGAVSDDAGNWDELSYAGEYWRDDPTAFTRHRSVTALVDGLTLRRDRRDAFRALRGHVLRSELYALDGSADELRPYTVTESQYGLREESPPGTVETERRRVFFPFLTAQRITQWERGFDPLTQFTSVDGYDAVGQATVNTAAALPRRRAMWRDVAGAVVGTLAGRDVNETRILATHTRTGYAQPGPERRLCDRVAHTTTWALRAPPSVAESPTDGLAEVLAAQRAAAVAVHDRFTTALRTWQLGEPLPATLRVIGHTLNHYDGPAFTGRPVGEVGPYGALTRCETLVLTDEELDDAYGDRRPAYLGGAGVVPAGAPAGFGADIGYRREAASAAGYHDGYYADTARRRLDVQTASVAEPHGLVLAAQDPLGHEVTIDPDRFRLLPERVTDPAGLTTTVEYDERTLLPATVAEANGHTTTYAYTPLGLLEKVVLVGRDGEGGTASKPEIEYTYDLKAYERTRQQAEPQPISVAMRRRVRHASDGASDETIETREYSDGFGRLIQTRTQADELLFGEVGDDVGLSNVAGEVLGPALGRRATARVIVNGWHVFDNKGRVVERYEPFFARGWAYQPEIEARRGQHTELFYDSRGELVHTRHPDGSEQRLILGTVEDPADLTTVSPTPWERYTYDANDLSAAAPAAHRFTPASAIVDALGRVVCRIDRNGTNSSDGLVTRSEYDIRDNVVTVRDSFGRSAFRYAYDLTNRSLRNNTIDAGLRTTVLDGASNPIEYRDSKGGVVLRGYDGLNRLTHLWARDDASGPLTLREHLEYGDAGDPNQPANDRVAQRSQNRLGRVHRHYDEAGLVQLDRYDFKGNPVEKTRYVIADAELASGWTADWSVGGADSALDAVVYATSMTYDALNRVAMLTYRAQQAGAVEHQATLTPHYGRSGTLERMELDGSPYVEHIAHNAKGQRVLIAFGNGVMTRYAYDPAAFRLTRLRSERFQHSSSGGEAWQGQGAPLQELTYTYDPAGNVVAIDDRTPSSGVDGSVEGRDRLTRYFDYDPLYRLTRATGRACVGVTAPSASAGGPGCGSYRGPYQAGAPVPNQDNAPDLTERYTETYDYDAAGNLISIGYSGTSGAGWNRTFGTDTASNRLKTVAQGATVFTLDYDANGNLTRENGDRHYRWDHADRLSAFAIAASGAAQPSVESCYLYGADGQRVKKWRRAAGMGEGDSTVYIDGAFEHVTWTKPGRPTAEHYVLHVMDDERRIALVRRGPAYDDDAGPAIQYQFADHLGSSSVVVDDAGAWINREEYFPYGATSFGGFARKRYRFTGKERDEHSGLAYHGARYYAPWLARWISPDPAGLAGGQNPFTYAMNSPMRHVDRLGLEATDAGAAPEPRVHAVPPPPAPPTSPRAQLSEDRDDAGSVMRRRVELIDAGSAFVPYDPAIGCYRTSTASVSLITSAQLIEGPHLMDPDHPGTSPSVWPPRLTTWTAARDSADNVHVSITFDPERTKQTLAYAKSAIDRGLPVVVGVNENNQIARDPFDGGRINKGITAHSLIIKGYQQDVEDGGWVVTELHGMDNATGTEWQRMSETWPTFRLDARGAMVKPASDAGSQLAAAQEYSITEMRVYRRDFGAVKALDAWFGPRTRLVPTPRPDAGSPAR